MGNVINFRRGADDQPDLRAGLVAQLLKSGFTADRAKTLTTEILEDYREFMDRLPEGGVDFGRLLTEPERLIAQEAIERFALDVVRDAWLVQRAVSVIRRRR